MVNLTGISAETKLESFYKQQEQKAIARELEKKQTAQFTKDVEKRQTEILRDGYSAEVTAVAIRSLRG